MIRRAPPPPAPLRLVVSLQPIVPHLQLVKLIFNSSTTRRQREHWGAERSERVYEKMRKGSINSKNSHPLPLTHIFNLILFFPLNTPWSQFYSNTAHLTGRRDKLEGKKRGGRGVGKGKGEEAGEGRREVCGFGLTCICLKPRDCY